MERRRTSRRNGLIRSFKKDNFDKVIFSKDRQCFSALPILFYLFMNEPIGISGTTRRGIPAQSPVLRSQSTGSFAQKNKYS